MPVTPLSEVQASQVAPTPSAADLGTVLAEPITRPLRNGETIIVRPVKFGRIKPFIEAVTPLYSLINAQGRGGLNPAELALEHSDDVSRLLCVCLSKESAWVDELDLDEVAALFADVVEVNLDFFIRHVLPTLSGRVAGVVAGLQHGRKASPTSSNA